MLILAIDTALEACAAAVLDTDAGELLARESQLMKRGHAEALMPMIARVMQRASLAFASLDRIAVTVGPGSFTGLRVGISAARGLALAAKRPAVGLTTLSAYAAGVVGQSGTAPVISAIDARHDHVYFQIVAGDGSQLVRPCVAAIDAAIAASQFGAPHLVGNAANILADRWPKEGPQPVAVDAQPAPDISWIAWLGAAANPDTNPARPFYLKAPDAKPAAQTPLAARAATS
ncbi:tRNA (adenosine(37)-N6)-threonylcarbamoyltransferase complex dimerization subunit type 1 TsaB [Bradyrhizobium liaoningense]|uniref:tRNA (adenosine(37)-N6)-threonylcarbamoyltransferase complex dimerization subunit type 1 TsaB n=1 Tax=Bradyrhizobium liaoningense TaxID=43992 RepID=UPI001BA539C3|nr:tRNA (adenosine(37)-N6)-threonylcarbamoyltransferase complex dimerization subunit type 1 TsaB [Bradyrhizobium liaoningense]MBR1169543.1 tRNA (adenosine(37)-N6)-threonylcarbamoyltransferase complex dimerization subunit type 1 TsaB [Bradyrhizobium liaoningense]